jgi:hypothetical protein
MSTTMMMHPDMRKPHRIFEKIQTNNIGIIRGLEEDDS